MRARRKFLQLTRYTYPYGTESFLKSYLPKGYKTDKHGNYYLLVGNDPTCMFTCHLDTANSRHTKVTHVQTEKFIKTNGKTILGADDKAGMVVVLSMIEKKVPGLYYFFIGEEVGCIGSGLLAEDWDNFEFADTIKKVISFDRRDVYSVITHQFCGRCCSDEFASELAYRLNISGENMCMVPDETGILTDSAQFTRLVPECTNISVGYYNEHTTSECQDIEFLSRLCRAACKIDWETLPIARNPSLVDIGDFDYDDFLDDIEDDNWSPEYYSHFKINGDIKKMYIAKSVIKVETNCIRTWLANSDVIYRDIFWDGNTLSMESLKGDIETLGSRYEISKILPEIGSVHLHNLCENPYGYKKVRRYDF